MNCLKKLTLVLGMGLLLGAPVQSQEQPDDGYTYRIGEVNPYNDNTWYRYYRGVRNGSNINKLYSEMKARQGQRDEDRRYYEGVQRRYDEGRRRWDQRNEEYRRELRAYNSAARALEDAKRNLNKDQSLFSARRVYDESGNLIDDDYIQKLQEDLEDRQGEIDRMMDRLSEMSQELNRFYEGMERYRKGAEWNIRMITELSNQYNWHMRSYRPPGNTGPHAGMTPFG